MAQQHNDVEEKTAAINHYDGIFKFVHERIAQEPFLQARKFLAQQRWEDAVAAFEEAKAQAKKQGNEFDVGTVELVLQELADYKKRGVPEGVAPKPVDWSSVSRRAVIRYEEPSDRLPQGLFFLNVGPVAGVHRKRLIGRKSVSGNWLANRIPELFCSLVRPDMLLGEFMELRVTDRSVIIFYHPLEDGEKLQVFDEIYQQDGKDAELVFPFPLLKTATRKEFTSPTEGWHVDDVYDDMLSNGEEHIRDYTVQFFKSMALTKPVFYDPACSTGVFLSTLKEALPDSYTIGQDLSKQMTDVARERLDESHHGNALEPKINPASAQAVFIRFLNSEVVTSAEAEMLLPPVMGTTSVGGLFIVLGHTPVLLSAANFRSLPHFRLERCVAVDVQRRGIFQYYVLKRIQS